MKQVLFTLLSLMFVTSLHADGRRYVWTYEYLTMHRGEAELETYTDFSHVDTDSGRLNSTTLQYEYEIGMNDRYDVGIYQVFKQSPDSPIHYDGFKVRMRYRFGEKGKWFMDPLLYLEFKNNGALDHPKLESKLILARDFGKLNLALNPVLEFEFEDDETEMEFEYAAGLSYNIHPLLTLGVETKGSADSFYWGPTISHGKPDLWFGVGLLTPGMGDDVADRKIRCIIGVAF